jgi:Zn-dependent protease
VGGQLHLGRLFGIPIVAGISWLIWLFVMLLVLQRFFPPEIAGSDGRAFGLALVVVAIYVVALLGHEFGHALMARALGIETERVELWMLGGLAHLSRGARSPKEEFLVAAAGPAVTLVVAVAAGVVVGLEEGFSVQALWDIGSLRYSGSTTVSAVAGLVLFVEGAALLFNLLPALPLDGGRIARSVVWKATGSPAKATAATAQAGRGLAILLVVAGIYASSRNGSSWTLIWCLFLAWFIWQNAQAMVVPTERRAPTKSIVRADGVMDAQPVWVGAAETAAEAHEHAFVGDAPEWVVVLEPDGRLRGIVTAARIAEELDAGRPDTPVSALLAPGGRASTREDVLLHRLRKDRDLARLGALPVVDVDGLLVGVVSAEAVRQALVVEGGLRT